MDEIEHLLSRLALNAKGSIETVLAIGGDAGFAASPTPNERLLVRFGGLLALGAATTSLHATVEHAKRSGATEMEIVGVLIAVAPAIGLSRTVAIAAGLAAALGYDVDEDC